MTTASRSRALWPFSDETKKLSETAFVEVGWPSRLARHGQLFAVVMAHSAGLRGERRSILHTR